MRTSVPPQPPLGMYRRGSHVNPGQVRNSALPGTQTTGCGFFALQAQLQSLRMSFHTVRKVQSWEAAGGVGGESGGEGVNRVRSLRGLTIPKFSGPRNPNISPRKLHEIKRIFHTQLKPLSNGAIEKAQIERNPQSPRVLPPSHPTMNLTLKSPHPRPS